MTELDQLPAARPMPPAAKQATRQMLEELVSAEIDSVLQTSGQAITSRSRRPRRRWASRAVVAGVTSGLVIGGGAAAAYVAFAPASNQSIARCFSVPTPGSDDDYYGTDVALARPADSPVDDPALVTDALRLCAQAWRDGVIRPRSKDAIGPGPGVRSYPVPELTACVLDSGIAGVFPAGPGICAQLGLPGLMPVSD